MPATTEALASPDHTDQFASWVAEVQEEGPAAVPMAGFSAAHGAAEVPGGIERLLGGFGEAEGIGLQANECILQVFGGWVRRMEKTAGFNGSPSGDESLIPRAQVDCPGRGDQRHRSQRSDPLQVKDRKIKRESATGVVVVGMRDHEVDGLDDPLTELIARQAHGDVGIGKRLQRPLVRDAVRCRYHPPRPNERPRAKAFPTNLCHPRIAMEGCLRSPDDRKGGDRYRQNCDCCENTDENLLTHDLPTRPYRRRR